MGVSYTGLVLDSDSASKLIEAVRSLILPNWEVICHHMTINLGDAKRGDAAALLGTNQSLTAVAIASNDLVIAVKVETDVPSDNATKHITIAVNRKDGGKPFMSNKLCDWATIPPIKLSGSVQEV